MHWSTAAFMLSNRTHPCMDGSACESPSMTCVPITSFSAGCEVRNLSAHVSYRHPRSVRLGRRTSRKASKSQRGSLVLPLLSLTKRHRNSPYLALVIGAVIRQLPFEIGTLIDRELTFPQRA